MLEQGSSSPLALSLFLFSYRDPYLFALWIRIDSQHLMTLYSIKHLFASKQRASSANISSLILKWNLINSIISRSVIWQLPLWSEHGEPSCYCYSFQSSESILIWSKCATNLSIFSSKAALIFCRECICPKQGFGALGESELILNTIRGLRVRFGKYSIRRELQMRAKEAVRESE